MITFLVILLLILFFLLYSGIMKIFENKDERTGHVRIKAALDRVKSQHKLSISEIDFSLDQVRTCKVNKEIDQLTGCTKNATPQLNSDAGDIARFTFYDETRDKIRELLSRFRMDPVFS